jgi:2-succinyl-6-hydroxy-2,4-cyclohexadiene-1-carboxylate synthase
MPELAANGIDYHVTESGSGDPLVLLHGFTGSTAAWTPLVDRLAGTHRVVAIDIMGHGRSARPPDSARYAFAAVIDDLREIACRLGLARAVWLGYSMGGRLALALALHQPDLVSALVLESASPGIADDAERRRRRAADEELARRIEADGVAAFVAEWERLPLWESQRTLAPADLERQRDIRLGQSAVGLANSLRGMGQGAQPSYWDRLEELAAPVLLLVGARDRKHVEIAGRMNALLPRSTLWIVPDAGHAVHLEEPEVYADLVADFAATDERNDSPVKE